MTLLQNTTYTCKWQYKLAFSYCVLNSKTQHCIFFNYSNQQDSGVYLPETVLAGEGGIEDRGVVIVVPRADIHTGTDPLGTPAPPGLGVGSGVFTEVKVEASVGDEASGSFLSETGSCAFKKIHHKISLLSLSLSCHSKQYSTCTCAISSDGVSVCVIFSDRGCTVNSSVLAVDCSSTLPVRPSDVGSLLD